MKLKSKIVLLLSFIVTVTLISCKKQSASKLFSKTKKHDDSKCETVKSCEDICKELKSDYKLDRNQCEKQEVGHVETFDSVLKALEKSKLAGLQDIDYEILEILHDADNSAVEQLLESAIADNSTSAQSFFAWYAGNEDIATLFQKSGLLAKAATQVDSDKPMAFVTDLSRVDVYDNKDKNTFLGIATAAENEEALQDAHSIIFTGNSTKAEAVYCHKSLEDRDDYMNDENDAFDKLNSIFPKSYFQVIGAKRDSDNEPFEEIDTDWCDTN